MSLLKKLSIRDVILKNKRVLIRVDFNVPLKNGKITSNYRIVQTLPTIKSAIENGATSVILMSHLGRPNGKPVYKYSLKPVAKEVEKLLKRPVMFLDNCVGTETEKICKNAKGGQIILLENLRYHAEEEGYTKTNGQKVQVDNIKVKKFRTSLTSLGDVYINDAFGTVHRAHSSIVGIELPQRAAGYLLEKELDHFNKLLENPDQPFLAIIGGAKVSDKIQLIEKMLDKVDSLIVCGGMAFTFKKVHENMKIGSSLYNESGARLVANIMEKAHRKKVKIILPVDFLTANKLEDNPNTEYFTDVQGIPDGWLGLDSGEKSNQLFRDEILNSKTIVWNGPPGVFELASFSRGTKIILDAVVEATKNGATTIISGSDTSAAALGWKINSEVTHISTGGGAFLKLLEGTELPGIISLSEKN